MNKALSGLAIGLSLLLLFAVVPKSAKAQSQYTITQITSGSPDHLSPAMNNNGDIVWTQMVNGFSQVFILAKGQSSPSLLPGQQANHNDQFPVIDDARNVVYVKDGVGGGAGLAVVRNSGGVETTIEFSSGNPPGCTVPPAGPVTCTAFRSAGQHFGVSGSGTIISYFDFTFNGAHTRHFDVTGTGTLQCGLTACDFGFDDYPSLNNKGDFIFVAAGQVQKSSLASPSATGMPVALGLFGRINNSGDVVVISAGGLIQVYLAPDYSNTRIVHAGTWAGIDDIGTVVFQDVDGSGVQQIFRAVFSPQAIDISDYNDPTTGRPADPYALTAPFWTEVQSQGTRIAVVSGFGGRTSNSNAATLLNLARTTQGGMFTALYCYLNYQETGTVQIAQHCLIPTLGESAFLKFVAVDVEPAFVGSSTVPQRIQIIGDAVKAVTQAGLTPVMYTNRCAWNQITNNSTLFSGLPLWDVANDSVPDLATDFHTNCQGTPGPAPFIPYGGWSSRGGKQYDLGGGNGTRLFGVDVDLDVFSSSLFSSSPPPNTPQGYNVFTQPLDNATGTTPVTVSFASVQQAGTTTLSTSSTGPAIPSGLQLGSPPIFYDVATSATFTPPVLVCINYSMSNFANPSSLRLLHFENGSWVDQTYFPNPPIPQAICALVSSLSPFVVVQSSADTIPPVSTATVSPNPNAAGWNNTNVTVTLNSSDSEAGGTGVKQITYSAMGAQTIASTVVNGPSASFTISTEGMTTVAFFGTDNAGNVETARTLTIKIDKTPPSITVFGRILTSREEEERRVVHIAISGKITDSTSGVVSSSAAYMVSDEDGILQTSGSLALAADGTYGLTVSFKKRRHGNHEDESDRRLYELTVSAKDNAGNQGSSSTLVDRDDDDHDRHD